MAKRMMGPKGSTRRRRFLFVPLLLAACIALFVVAGAQAVHDTGCSSWTGTLRTTRPRIRAATTGVTTGTTSVTRSTQLRVRPSSPTRTGATAVSWTAEPNPSSSIFTGGGSKDPQDISNWAWKDGPAACRTRTTCCTASRPATRCRRPRTVRTSATDATNCDVLYFGSDRFDNSGDAQQGFWFFQNKITLGNSRVGGGNSFTGVHKPGDLLVISDFSNGGTTSTITVYKWDRGAVSGQPASFLAQSDANAKCDLQAPTTPSAGSSTEPTDPIRRGVHGQERHATTTLEGRVLRGRHQPVPPRPRRRVLLELRLRDPLLDLDHRDLKDFVLGQFAVCGATLTTTPSAGVTEGPRCHRAPSVTDLAASRASGTPSPPTPTGNVTFFLCGADGARQLDGVCTPGGTQVGSAKALADSSPPPGEASATSDAVNTAASPLAPGRYCFRAVWPGDTNYPGSAHVGTGTVGVLHRPADRDDHGDDPVQRPRPPAEQPGGARDDPVRQGRRDGQRGRRIAARHRRLLHLRSVAGAGSGRRGDLRRRAAPR